MCKKGSIIEATVVDTVFPNKGLVYANGKEILVHGALKGQRLRIQIVKHRRGRIEAKILEVLERSPLEQEPTCQQFGLCGGCTYLNVPYKHQLEIKESQVLRLLDNAGITGFDFLGIEPSPRESAYRNKMEYTFGDSDDGLALGLHRRRMRYEVSPVTGCQLVDEDFLLILDLVLDHFREIDIPFYHKKSHQGVLRNLVVRKAGTTGEILVNLVTTSQRELTNLTELGEDLGELSLSGRLKGFLHTINDGKADTIRADSMRVIWGDDHITEVILGLTFRISAFSFFQTNSYGAEKLFGTVQNFAESRPGTVFDLYCGTGTIAQIISPLADEVFGIEIVPEAIEAARENAKINGLDNCRFIAGDVLIELDALDKQPDLVILDPPRGGIHPKALEKIIGIGAPHLVYVSCQPVSLAKDLAVLASSGYSATMVKCVDMFPHTPHIETVVKLE